MAVPKLDVKRLPRHVGIIMDGNGRWASRHGLPRAAGHEAGAKSVRAVVEACRELGGVEVLSLYAFSTENWRRSRLEVAALFRLLSRYIALEVDNLHKENIRVAVMGRWQDLPKRAAEGLRRMMAQTADNTAMTLNLAINYGARAEIADAARAIAQDTASGKIRPEDVDEKLFARHLYCPDLPDLDLLIRTSGELRLSNFMLWQVSYAEIVVTETLWPDFGKEQLYDAIREYQGRTRRFGGR